MPRWLPEYKLIEDADAMGDDRVGFVLFLLLRDVRTWVESAPAHRRALLLSPSQDRMEIIQYASEHTPGIAEAMQDLSAMRLEPERVTTAGLGAACRRIYRWADRRSLSKVALLFAEAAARIDPLTSRIASDAARAARHAGHPDRAECWYDRGIGLAGRHGNRNRRDIISALLGKGTVLREQRRFDEAREILSRAAKLCASTRRHRLAAETQHDLFALAVMAGTYPEAETHMSLALEHYPVHHPGIPGLVHDWCFLLVQRGLYAQAIPLLQASIPNIRRVEIQLVSWGTLARAAAGAGIQGLYDEAVQHIDALVERTQEFAAAALAHAAYGARFFREWEAAEALANRARETAITRGETEVADGVQEFLTAIRAKEAPLSQTEPPEGSRISEIGERMMRLIEAHRRPTRRPVEPTREREAGGPLMPARRKKPD